MSRLRNVINRVVTICKNFLFFVLFQVVSLLFLTEFYPRVPEFAILFKVLNYGSFIFLISAIIQSGYLPNYIMEVYNVEITRKD